MTRTAGVNAQTTAVVLSKRPERLQWLQGWPHTNKDSSRPTSTNLNHDQQKSDHDGNDHNSNLNTNTSQEEKASCYKIQSARTPQISRAQYARSCGQPRVSEVACFRAYLCFGVELPLLGGELFLETLNLVSGVGKNVLHFPLVVGIHLLKLELLLSVNQQIGDSDYVCSVLQGDGSRSTRLISVEAAQRPVYM